MTKMLCVEWMSLCHLTDLVDCLFIDFFIRVFKMFPNERLPLFFRDRTERVMPARPVKRTIFIEHHLLDQMFAAAEKQVTNAVMVLNYAAELSLYAIASIL